MPPGVPSAVGRLWASRYVTGMAHEPPAQRIVDFAKDAAGDWYALLECGHRQHVRHRPPLEERPWVLSDDGRRGRLGARLPCKNCLMPVLPSGLAVYEATPWFDLASTPPGLLRSHRLRAGSWALIRVERGIVAYTIESSPALSFALSESLTGVVEPELPHRVAPSREARFRLEFLR